MVIDKDRAFLITLSIIVIGIIIYFSVTISNLKKQINSLETDYTNLRSDYDSLEIKHNILQSSYDLLKTDISFLQASINTLELTAESLLPYSSEEEENTCKNIDVAVEIWLKNNLDKIAKPIAELITMDLPIVKDIATELVSEALSHFLQWEIIKMDQAPDSQTCIARTRLILPISIDLPLLSKEYKVQVDYLLYIRGGNVMDSDIDASSFEMK